MAMTDYILIGVVAVLVLTMLWPQVSKAFSKVAENKSAKTKPGAVDSHGLLNEIIDLQEQAAASGQGETAENLAGAAESALQAIVHPVPKEKVQ